MSVGFYELTAPFQNAQTCPFPLPSRMQRGGCGRCALCEAIREESVPLPLSSNDAFRNCNCRFQLAVTPRFQPTTVVIVCHASLLRIGTPFGKLVSVLNVRTCA